jgi:ABC-type transport system involved in multi-copper enzyme maturation permease subunit
MGRPVRFDYAAQIQYDDIQERNLLFFLFTPPDFASIVKVILSLLAMLFVFDSISGEKESGTLKLLLSQPIPRHTILLGKWLGGYITILFPFLTAFLVGLLVLWIFPFLSLHREDWIRIGIIGVLSLLYLSIFLSLGLFVSARTRKASTSVLVSLFVWVMLVLVIPNLGNLIAKEVLPISSRMKVEALKYKTARELEDNASRQGKKADTHYGGYGSAHFDIWPEVRGACQSLEEKYRTRSDQLARLAKGIARISPASSFAFSTMALARTGIKDERRYEHALSRHIDEFARLRFAEGHKSPPFWSWRTSRKVNFTSTERSLAESLHGTLMDVFLLAFFAIFFFMGAYISFLRYDPT